jgi:transposase InsO family protein
VELKNVVTFVTGVSGERRFARNLDRSRLGRIPRTGVPGVTCPRPTLPQSWPRRVRSALLHVIALAQYAVAHTRSRAVAGGTETARRKAEHDRLRQEVALLREELRLKDARLARIPAARRPHYQPVVRMAILELRAARGWSLQQTADTFHVTAATVASWMKRLDERGPHALVQLRAPVNRFPDFVRCAVQRLKVLCPQLGKVKIAEVLARAGLHLAPTTVGRMLKEQPPEPAPAPLAGAARVRRVTARRPDHVWHVDLTTVPNGRGFWAPWPPCALPQRWPFCWWVAVVLDHFSRRVVAFAVFRQQPTSTALRALLGRTIHLAGTAPKHLVCDKGGQFCCAGFTAWAVRRGIRLRFSAVGRHGGLAVIERFIGTLKREGTRRGLVPFRRAAFHREVALFIDWYNAHRPHMTLAGGTPDEVYHRRRPLNRRPRREPRPQWPRPSPCAGPRTLVAGQPGARIELDVEFLCGRRHLPLVKLSRAA